MLGLLCLSHSPSAMSIQGEAHMSGPRDLHGDTSIASKMLQVWQTQIFPASAMANKYVKLNKHGLCASRISLRRCKTYYTSASAVQQMLDLN